MDIATHMILLLAGTGPGWAEHEAAVSRYYADIDSCYRCQKIGVCRYHHYQGLALGEVRR